MPLHQDLGGKAPLLAPFSARQPHRKFRAFAGLARDCHVAAHQAGELAGDGEAQAGTAELLRGRGIGLFASGRVLKSASSREAGIILGRHDLHTAHVARLVRSVVGNRVVHRADVVPHQHVALRPLVRVKIFLPRLMLE
jgi:hypothetical protein